MVMRRGSNWVNFSRHPVYHPTAAAVQMSASVGTAETKLLA